VERYSNFGATVEIMAPGGDVRRDDNGDGQVDGVLSMVDGGYALYNGTSWPRRTWPAPPPCTWPRIRR
jgi:serine protease